MRRGPANVRQLQQFVMNGWNRIAQCMLNVSTRGIDALSLPGHTRDYGQIANKFVS